MVSPILEFCRLKILRFFSAASNSLANWYCWCCSPTFRYFLSCPTLLEQRICNSNTVTYLKLFIATYMRVTSIGLLLNIQDHVIINHNFMILHSKIFMFSANWTWTMTLNKSWGTLNTKSYCLHSNIQVISMELNLLCKPSYYHL